ncbi:MAG: response regulator [Gemmatimonadota bacterium]
MSTASSTARIHILVAEPDATTQLLLRRIFERLLEAEVTVVDSGPEALVALESNTPDLALLAHELPIIHGLSVLAAVRRSKALARLPIAFASRNSDKAFVRKIIDLGVSDYLLKPLDLGVTEARLAKTLAMLRARRERFKSDSMPDLVARRTLLLVGADLNFLTLAESLLEGKFDLVSATNASEALEAYAKYQPEVVVVDEGLDVFNETLFAQTLRSWPGLGARNVYLISEREDCDAIEPGVFDGVIKRCFVPDIFLDSFNRILFGAPTNVSRLDNFLQDSVRSALVTAVRQTFGVMLSVEITELTGPDAIANVSKEILASVRLRNVGSSPEVGFRLGLMASQSDVWSFAGILFGSEDGLGETDVYEALEEIGRSVAGRIRAALHSMGVTVEQGDSGVSKYSEIEFDAEQWSLHVACETKEGHKLVTAMRVW